MGHVVVRQGHVEGILSGDEGSREKSTAGAGVRVIKSAEISVPRGIPRTFVIGDRIVVGGFFADPENGGDDVTFPREAAEGGLGGGGDNGRLDF